MQTEIINRALIKIGERPVSSVNELPLGSTYKILYETNTKLLIASYPWRFAMKRTVLTPLDEESKNPRFKNVFQLPSDFLSLAGVGIGFKPADLRNYRATSGTVYEIEQDKIYYNDDTLYLSYFASTFENFSETFKEALACRLASEMSIKINQNPNMKQLMQADFQMAIDLAIRQNEIIADSEEIGDNSWVSIREGWRNEY